MDETSDKSAPRPTSMNAEPRVPDSRYWPTPLGKLITAAILELIDEKKAALDAEHASENAGQQPSADPDHPQ